MKEGQEDNPGKAIDIDALAKECNKIAAEVNKRTQSELAAIKQVMEKGEKVLKECGISMEELKKSNVSEADLNEAEEAFLNNALMESVADEAAKGGHVEDKKKARPNIKLSRKGLRI